MGDLSFKDKLSLLLTRKRTFTLETTSMGILWTRCLQKLASTMLDNFIKEGKSPAELQKEWDQLIEYCFRDLNEENLDEILNTLDTKGLEEGSTAHSDLSYTTHCSIYYSLSFSLSLTLP